MKKLFILTCLMLVAVSAQAQVEILEKKVNAIDSIGKTLMGEYVTLMRKETKTDAEDTRLKELDKQLETLQDEQVALIVDYAKANGNDAKVAPFLQAIAPALSYEELSELITPDKAYYNAPELEDARKIMETLKLRAPGTHMKELTMTDPQGKTVKLSDWCGKGNYVLVDFWASWCGPCRMEMPNVVKAYNTYKDKGFDVVGVSFDNKPEPWKKAIESLQMPWHHMSDLKGWGCAAVGIYGVNSIPANILVDGNGVIVASDLRGEKLQNKLAELYKQ